MGGLGNIGSIDSYGRIERMIAVFNVDYARSFKFINDERGHRQTYKAIILL